MLLRRIVLIAAVIGVVAHAATLFRLGNAAPGPLISDLIQFFLGALAIAAAALAARQSRSYAAKIWWLAALALGIYTAGQGIVIYYDNVLHAPLFSPWISDQFLFFWVVPLAMAVLIDRWAAPGKLDWALVLDFCQVFLVALALHVSVFALASTWQSEGRQLAFLEWQVRLLRDAIVLAALWPKVFLSSVHKTRSLFLRLGIFFLAYTIADGIYLYAEAAWQNTVGSWLDLLWTVPRFLLICGAATWEDAPEAAPEAARPRRSPKQALPLHLASILGPLLVVMAALRISPSDPVMAAVLVSLSFLCASIRFLITQNRQEIAAAELRSSRDLLEAVVEGTTEAIYVRDLDGRYLFANLAARRFLGGTTDADVLGRSNRDFFSEKSATRSALTDLEVMRSGHAQTFEELMELANSTVVFLTTKAPYRSASGKVNGVLGIAVDVTERRKMEEELRKAQRMESIGTLAGGVAHDFNNLLTVIKGYSQLLIDEMAGTPAQDKLRQIDSAAEKAATLTRQLLAFSRQQVLQPKVVNLNHIVRDMEKILRRLIGEDIDFSVQLGEELSSILADPGQLEQVVMNLAANARDAMPRGGKFTIETMNAEIDDENPLQRVAPGRYVVFTVSDTGVGMDQATQARIFEPFFTTKPPGKGTGLGLSTVYGITKQSGGYIWVDSDLGHGTTFKMYFPVVDRAAPPTEPEPKSGQREDGHETILVVEDEATLSKLVETSLKKKGYSVLVASSGKDAESIAQNHAGPIHLLLTDVVMPQTSGREVAERVCRLRPQTRVLWMSGYTDDTIVHHGMLEPGVHFLQKPFTPSALADKVREVLDNP